MKIIATSADVTKVEADAVVVGIYEGENKDTKAPLVGPAAVVNQAMGGLLEKLIEAEELSAGKYKTTTFYAPAGMAAELLVVVGLGKQKSFDRGTAHRVAASAMRSLAGKSRESVAFYLGDDWASDVAEAAVSGAVVGSCGQDLCRAEKKQHAPKSLLWAGADSEVIERGEIVGESINLTRRLVNEPADVLFPESFAKQAEETAKECGVEVEVWDEKRLAEERCGALLAVAQGSPKTPRLVILRYNGGKPGDAPLALVGKGVTFDSGGLSIKTGNHMMNMKMDMGGAATVLGAVRAIAKLKLPINLIGILGMVENMPAGNAYKLGDVLTARNGKTIEVHNTDAEGRLVLADALAVAVDLGAARIIDLATLTGACVVALGLDVAGLLPNDQSWCDTIAEAAKTCGEQAWQLPMFDEFGEQIKSEVADIKNVGEGRWAGTITAAKFLEEFVDGRPWTHIDIAGPAFIEKSKPWISGGGSGAFVQTLIEVARKG